MQKFDLNCDALRKAGFRISFWTHYSSGSFVWLENTSLKLFIYAGEWKVYVTGKSTRQNSIALRRIREALTISTVTAYLK